MTNDLTSIELALINELVSRRASLAEFAEHFPSLTIDDINFHSIHHSGKYRRWDTDQDDLLIYMAQSYLTIDEMKEGIEAWFGFSRSEGALISRLKRFGFTHYKEELKKRGKVKIPTGKPSFKRYMEAQKD
jgi:hypothetical protein